MIKLFIIAHENREKGEKLLKMLIIANMKKVMKQERKWLVRALNNLKSLKAQRLFHAWKLEVKRRICKRKLRQHMKRNVIIATRKVLEIEALKTEAYSRRRLLLKSLLSIKLRSKQRAETRKNVEKSISYSNVNRQRQLF